MLPDSALPAQNLLNRPETAHQVRDSSPATSGRGPPPETNDAVYKHIRNTVIDRTTPPAAPSQIHLFQFTNIAVQSVLENVPGNVQMSLSVQGFLHLQNARDRVPP